MLTIEGVGRDKKTNDVVHHAFAVVSNAPDGSLRFSSWLVDGRHTQAQGKVLGPGSFSWELKVPHGTVRYTLTCQGDTWTEEGAFSPKPGVWRPSFGMSLTRVK